MIALANHQNSKINVIPEPRHAASGRGAPDVKFKIGESILGYLENKKIDANLDQVLKSDQIAKYKKLSGNLILTNYLQWVWTKDGAVIERETLDLGQTAKAEERFPKLSLSIPLKNPLTTY